MHICGVLYIKSFTLWCVNKHTWLQTTHKDPKYHKHPQSYFWQSSIYHIQLCQCDNMAHLIQKRTLMLDETIMVQIICDYFLRSHVPYYVSVLRWQSLEDINHFDSNCLNCRQIVMESLLNNWLVCFNCIDLVAFPLCSSIIYSLL